MFVGGWRGGECEGGAEVFGEGAEDVTEDCGEVDPDGGALSFVSICFVCELLTAAFFFLSISRNLLLAKLANSHHKRIALRYPHSNLVTFSSSSPERSPPTSVREFSQTYKLSRLSFVRIRMCTT